MTTVRIAAEAKSGGGEGTATTGTVRVGGPDVAGPGGLAAFRGHTHKRSRSSACRRSQENAVVGAANGTQGSASGTVATGKQRPSCRRTVRPGSRRTFGARRPREQTFTHFRRRSIPSLPGARAASRRNAPWDIEGLAPEIADRTFPEQMGWRFHPVGGG